MTINERVSPKRLAEIIARAEVCDDSVLTDYRDIESIARELQQYRAAAEPVAWRWNYGGSTNWRLTETKPNFAGKYVQHFVEPLYAAPQVTSVPPFELFWSEFKHPFAEDDELKSFASEIWNACCGAAPAVQAGQEPIYQLRDVDWYDTDKRTYDTVVNTGGAGRIVYAAPQLPQPAVVPDAIEIDDDFDSAFEHGKAVGWNACRAAMLTAAPAAQPEQLSGNTEQVSQPVLPATQFKPVADLYEMQFDDGRTFAFHTDPEKAIQWLNTCGGNKVQEYVKLERLQDAITDNSPVIPDYWTGSDKANAALVMLDRIDTLDPVDDDRIEGIKRIIRELAAAPKQEAE